MVSRGLLYQVSTSSALVEGVYQGAVLVGNLRKHGNLGLGTFEKLDGEMVIVDGHFYQVCSDGSVREVGDDALSPFAVVTHFKPDLKVVMKSCPDLQSLSGQFDELRHSDNFFFALRVDGHFDSVRTRAMRPTEEGVPLVMAAAHQPEFEFHDIIGTLVGFWTPQYAKGINVPGYHFHFLSHDRTRGGHLLECTGDQLCLEIQREGNYRVVLPETKDFFKADLNHDTTDALQRAESHTPESKSWVRKIPDE